MNKKILFSIITSSLISASVFASNSDEYPAEYDQNHTLSKSGVSFDEIAAKNMTAYATSELKRTVVKEVSELLDSTIPGGSILVGAAYIYSGTDADRAKYDHTIARVVGDTVRMWVEELGGELVIEAANCLKPADANSLTEALVRVGASKFASIRTHAGLSAFYGDSAQAAVRMVPIVGGPIAAVAKTAGQYIDPDAKSLTEASMNVTGKAVLDKVAVKLDDFETPDSFSSLPNEEAKAQVLEEFKDRLADDSDFGDAFIWDDMKKRYHEIVNENSKPWYQIW